MPKTHCFTTSLFLLLCCFSLQAFAQEAHDQPASLPKLQHDAQTGFAIGGQIINDQFLYNTGPVFYYNATLPIGKHVRTGIGTGLQALENERIIPLFVHFKGFKNEQGNSMYLSADLGTTLAFSNQFKNFSNYSYTGGWHISPGIGYRLAINKRISFTSTLSYVHQNSWVGYVTFDQRQYLERVSYDLLVIRFGFLF